MVKHCYFADDIDHFTVAYRNNFFFFLKIFASVVVQITGLDLPVLLFLNSQTKLFFRH